MTKLTKTQIEYLDRKLERVINDKVEKFTKELGEISTLERILIDEIISGNINLLPNSEIINKLQEKLLNQTYFYPSLNINEMVSQEDKERVEKEFNERKTKLNEFKEKLYKAKQNILDSIVLHGVDIETALAELNKIN